MAKRNKRSKSVRVDFKQAKTWFTSGDFDQSGLPQPDGSPMPNGFFNSDMIEAVEERIALLEEAGFTVKHSVNYQTLNKWEAERHGMEEGAVVMSPWLNSSANRDGVSIQWRTNFGMRSTAGKGNWAYRNPTSIGATGWRSTAAPKVSNFTVAAEISSPRLQVRKASGGYVRESQYQGQRILTIEDCIAAANEAIPEEPGKYELPALIQFVEATDPIVIVKDTMNEDVLKLYKTRNWNQKDAAIVSQNVTSALVQRVAGVNKKGKVIRHSGNPKLAPFFYVTVYVLGAWRTTVGGIDILLGSDGYYVVGDRDTIADGPTGGYPPLNTLDREILRRAVHEFLEATYA